MIVILVYYRFCHFSHIALHMQAYLIIFNPNPQTAFRCYNIRKTTFVLYFHGFTDSFIDRRAAELTGSPNTHVDFSFSSFTFAPGSSASPSASASWRPGAPTLWCPCGLLSDPSIASLLLRLPCPPCLPSPPPSTTPSSTWRWGPTSAGWCAGTWGPCTRPVWSAAAAAPRGRSGWDSAPSTDIPAGSLSPLQDSLP